MRWKRRWHAGLAALLACGAPGDRKAAGADTGEYGVSSADSLALTSGVGTEVWFTLARQAVDSSGAACVERGLEIRNGQRRVKVPLLYTGARPVLVNDSTMRALLWTHCRPGDAYLVNLRTGHPVREGTASTP